jgi:glycosyltransferase involved in cell wall biosynthesis
MATMSQAAQDAAGVAVIMPCFNDGATIAEAARSAQGQARVQELIVVDDGSTDAHTLAVLDALRADGLTVLRQANAGTASARNTGIQAASADYIFCLDADDRLIDGALATLAHALDCAPQLAAVWGDYRTFGEASYVQPTADTLDPWQITYQNDLPMSALIRRSALGEAGGYSPAVAYEDWDLWMALAERSLRGRRAATLVYEYRLHGQRRMAGAAQQHAANYARLRQRHAALFARRWRSWRQSRAPLMLRLALPVIFALPVSADRRRMLAGVACHLAAGRGVRLLLRRLVR